MSGVRQSLMTPSESSPSLSVTNIFLRLQVYLYFLDGYNILILPSSGRYFEVPYGCLVPPRVNNLLVGGRCVSGDRTSHAAMRSGIFNFLDLMMSNCLSENRCYLSIISIRIVFVFGSDMSPRSQDVRGYVRPSVRHIMFKRALEES